MSTDGNSSERLLEVLSAEKSRLARRVKDIENRREEVDRFHRRVGGIVNGDYLVEVWDDKVPDSNVRVYVHTSSVDDVIVKFYDNNIITDINVERSTGPDFNYTVQITLDIDPHELAMDNYLSQEPQRR